ncbi:MAG: response regulator [Elusimicrobia bacterium]|nr:response regulator [Elusimicrobiota bacterium]
MESDSAPPLVLLADDEPQLLKVLKIALESGGFAVETASDGDEAWEKIRKGNIDLAILDLQMPGKDGLEVCRLVKEDLDLSLMPVILLTAASDTESKVRGLTLGVDDYITKPVNVRELLARIWMVFRRMRQELEANPLTRLPGNIAIEKRIHEAIAKGKDFAVLYIDLNQFKAYNDAYGYAAGDYVLKTTAKILVAAARSGNPGNFIGHIGGDDFIIATDASEAEAICQKIIDNFDRQVPEFYKQEDRERGYILGKDRRGEPRQFPLLSVAIGVATTRNRPLTSLGQVSQIGAELKSYAKTLGGSRCVVDRRKDN